MAADAAILTLPAGQPEHTLGWDVLAWCSEYIRQPDGPAAGEPWRFTAEQVRFVLWWYALTPRGRWVYTRGTLRRSKGWGKSPVMGALALAELCGPVRFDGWSAAGEPRAAPVSMPWVQLAGVSERQTVNTMSMVLAMVAEGPLIDDYGLDPGLTRIYYPAANGKLEPITASAPTAEGARPTFVVEDETHHWTDANGGSALDRVNRRNVGKGAGGTARVLETTNAHAPGVGSVAERSYDAWCAMRDGRAHSVSVLYDSREAPADVDLADEPALMAALRAAYGNSTWVDLERIRDEIYDPATPPADSRRFYLNQISAASDAWITAPEWAGCADPTQVVGADEPITLGFDGSRRRARGVTDATALVACRVSDGHTWPLAVWEQPDGPAGDDWQVPTVEVDAAVAQAFRDYTVVGMYADPARWETWVATWEARHASQLVVRATQAHPIEWWMTGGRSAYIVRALERFRGAVIDRELTHDGSYVLTRHVLNARRRSGRSGVQIAKSSPDSPHKIDAAVAAVLAFAARADALAAGVSEETVFARPSVLYRY
jgi:hypothetical protein